MIKAIAPKLAQGKLRNILRILHGMVVFLIYILAVENGWVAVWKYLLADLCFPPNDHVATIWDPQ